MAKVKNETKSRYFSSSSLGSKRKAEYISTTNSQSPPVRQSARVKKSILPNANLQESGSEAESDGTEYKSAAEKEEEDEDIDADDSDDNHSVTIPLPQPRTAGSTPYQDDRIHKNTFLFLADLRANNDREWFKCSSSILDSWYLEAEH